MRFIRACSFSERIGEEGMELIFRESIRINGPDSEDPDVYTETTVQEKNIAFPTDAKLHRKIIKQCEKISAREDLKVRQNYRRTIKKLAVDLRFRNHPKNKGKARKSDKKLKTIAGRLVREIERQLPSNAPHWNAIGIFNRVLSQTRTDKIKFTRYINLRENVLQRGGSIRSMIWE